MSYEFRKNTNLGSWCCLLLPFCLFPFVIKFSSDIYLLLFNVCLSSCFFPFPNIRDKTKNDNFSSHVSCLILSLPPSIFMWYFFSYDFIVSYTLSFMSIFHYGYLLKNLLVSCPGSFTFGEVQIIAQGIMLFSLSCAVAIGSKLNLTKSFPAFGVAIPEPIGCLQILLLGSLLLHHTLYMTPVLRHGLRFFICCTCAALVMMAAWNTVLKKNIFLWLWSFCTHNKRRIYLILFWLISTFASVLFVIVINKKPNPKSSTKTRKFFHLIIIVVFVPGIVFDLQLLRLASGVALTVFTMLEVFRILDIPVVGAIIENAFQVFLDEKDSGPVILTHIYLLIGCSSPVWLTGYITKGYHICLLSGVISVGFGDTAAAVGGTIFGKHKWKGSQKTYEGSLCAFIVQVLILMYFLYIGHECSFNNICLILAAAFLTTVLEAKTTQVDNLVLPLFMFSILSWVG